MDVLVSEQTELMALDLAQREALIRQMVFAHLAQLPPAATDEVVVATYFASTRTSSLATVGADICYHMTCGVRKPAPGSLLASCNGQTVDTVAFDETDRLGLVRVAFPLKMLLDAAGNLYSTDLLHIVAGAGAFSLTDYIDVKLVDLAMTDATLRRFPGPRYGAAGLRKLTGFALDEYAFGTILKPCTGITPEEESAIVEEAAANPLFLFIKEDENFLPGVPFAPLRQRMAASRAAIERSASRRGGKGLIFAPHITAPPHRLPELVEHVIEAGVNAVMFSEYYVGGMVRAFRELTRHMEQPPAIYGHNGGIDSMTHRIYREVLDLLGRLDGMDLRQTAPLSVGTPNLIHPCGEEWRNSERILSMPLAGHPTVMMARAGGLDQGNIIPNLADIEAGAGAEHYLLLAGSAINGIKNAHSVYDPQLGAQAMREAIEVFRAGALDPRSETHVAELKAYARQHGLSALQSALDQRYPAR